MKNFERKEVLERIAEYFSKSEKCPFFDDYDRDCENCPLSTGKATCLSRSNAKQEIFNWLNKEYKEPHKWLPWELEVLKHIDNYYDCIYKDNYASVCAYNSKRDYSSPININFDTLEDEIETMNIDEELERYGMSR